MNCLIKKDHIKRIKVTVVEKTYTFHMNMFLILLIYHLINVFFIFKEPTLENIQFFF